MARREFSGGYVVRDASGFVVADVYGRSTDDEATRPFLQTASLQVLPFTTICLKSILAGQLGRFASLGAHVSDLLSKIDEPGNGHEQRAPNALCIISQRTNFMNSGTVKFFNDQRGFGFIRPDNGDKDVFVHATALERAGIDGLREGQKVNFDTRNDPRTDKIAVDTIEIA